MIIEDIAHNWVSHIVPDFKAIIFTVKFIHSHWRHREVHWNFIENKVLKMLTLWADWNNCIRESTKFSNHFGSLWNIKTDKIIRWFFKWVSVFSEFKCFSTEYSNGNSVEREVGCWWEKLRRCLRLHRVEMKGSGIFLLQAVVFLVEMQVVYRARSGTDSHFKTCLEDRIPEFCPQQVGQVVLASPSSSY